MYPMQKGERSWTCFNSWPNKTGTVLLHYNHGSTTSVNFHVPIQITHNCNGQLIVYNLGKYILADDGKSRCQLSNFSFLFQNPGNVRQYIWTNIARLYLNIFYKSVHHFFGCLVQIWWLYLGCNYRLVQGVPTSFRWEVLVKNLKSTQNRILKFFVKKFVKLKWDLHCIAKM